MFGITRCFPATSSLMAEALAMREPAAVAVNFRLSLVILENDCLDLNRSCRKETKKGEIMNIVVDILAYTQTLRDCGFTWVAKEGNRVAHLIAKLSLQSVLPPNWRWHHPHVIEESLQEDKRGIPPRSCV